MSESQDTRVTESRFHLLLERDEYPVNNSLRLTFESNRSWVLQVMVDNEPSQFFTGDELYEVLKTAAEAKAAKGDE